MNKADLVRKLAKNLNITATQSAEIVTALFDADDGIIAKELSARRSVALAGFGVFRTAVRKAHRGRNPATGETIEVPDKRHPKFYPGTTLRANVSASGK